MYHSFKGLLSRAILTGLLFMSSEPVEAVSSHWSGYVIVLPTEITNLHKEVSHIMVTARGLDQNGDSVSLGVAFAPTGGDQNVIESISIDVDSLPDGNIFDAENIRIDIFPCFKSPWAVMSAAKLSLFDMNVETDATGQFSEGNNCSPANGIQPYSKIEGYSPLEFSVSDLSVVSNLSP